MTSRVVFFLLSGCLLLACSEKKAAGPNPTATVTSSDGKASLTIPAGALPQGVTQDQIKILPLREPPGTKGVTFLAGYELHPDGTKFLKPVKLDVKLTKKASTSLLVSHLSSATNPKFLPVTVRREQQKQNSIVAQVSLSHFSAVVFHAHNGFTMNWLVPPVDVFVAETFSVRLFVELNRSLEIEQPWGIGVLQIGRRNPAWSLSGSFRGNLRLLEPGYAANPPRDGPAVSDDRVDIAQSFRCRDAGSYVLDYEAHASANAPGLLVGAHATCHSNGRCYASHRVGNMTSFIYSNATCESSEDCSASSYGFDLNPLFIASGYKTAACLRTEVDQEFDWIDPSTDSPVIDDRSVDQTNFGYMNINIDHPDGSYLDPLGPNSCGFANMDQSVVCVDGGSTNMPAGDVAKFFMKLAGPVAGDKKASYVYSVVVDSDGDPANNWKAVAPNSWDFNQGADRFYQLKWDKKAWSLAVTQVDANQKTKTVPSTARAVIGKDTVTFHISASEFSNPKLGYRMTSFVHDGKFTKGSRGGDVSGKDPTRPLSRLTNSGTTPKDGGTPKDAGTTKDAATVVDQSTTKDAPSDGPADAFNTTYFAGVWRATVTVQSDPGGHAATIALPKALDLTVTSRAGRVSFKGASPWVHVGGNLFPSKLPDASTTWDSFNGTGSDPYKGFGIPRNYASISGRFTSYTTLVGTYTFTLDKFPPSPPNKPVIYTITATKK